PGSLAHVPRGRGVLALLRRWRGRPAASAVDPLVRRDAEHPGADVPRWFLERPERGEGACEGVLDQVLGVPGAPGQVPAVPVERGPERLDLFPEIAPGGLDGSRGRVVVHAGRDGRWMAEDTGGARRLHPRTSAYPAPSGSGGPMQSLRR